MTRPIHLWPSLILIAIIVTLVTVSVSNWFGGYGVPLAWKKGGCPPPGFEISASCLLAIGHDWLSFGLDALFYTIIGYSALFAYIKYNHSRIRNLMRPRARKTSLNEP